ncbi:hypothetical protein Thpro_023120 [Acidihalobacter prosperus]|uniref:Uncharacterized protein n=1 Tax=Acidihalobacter prosperus TaxID=160660 RepID=A0A1A6C2U9_9GAMM|nr:hypothetical protein Thpro_023120 [Acidihalobacter prosperus]
MREAEMYRCVARGWRHQAARPVNRLIRHGHRSDAPWDQGMRRTDLNALED